ncbi:MAG: TIGR04076 family protein [Candidatus Bathyarchaeota archaeon]|nr:TIGR04076 family protein [Candidatus Bathyarchaeum sp.]
MLEIEVCAIKGKCPVHNVGDKIIIDDPKILLHRTDALCTHALSSLLHYVLILESGADPVKLGLTKSIDKEHAYIQCVDPGQPYTDGGTVIFKITRITKNVSK